MFARSYYVNVEIYDATKGASEKPIVKSWRVERVISVFEVNPCTTVTKMVKAIAEKHQVSASQVFVKDFKRVS